METVTARTCTDDFFYLHAGDVDLFGEFVDSVVGIFVGEGINVNFYTWRDWRRGETWNVQSEYLELEKLFLLSSYVLVERRHWTHKIKRQRAGLFLLINPNKN